MVEKASAMRLAQTIDTKAEELAQLMFDTTASFPPELRKIVLSAAARKFLAKAIDYEATV